MSREFALGTFSEDVDAKSQQGSSIWQLRRRYGTQNGDFTAILQ
jgi:hypothetical protein